MSRLLSAARLLSTAGMVLLTMPAPGVERYELHGIANSSTLVPEGDGATFASFSPPALTDGRIVFRGVSSAGRAGLYTYTTGLSVLVSAFSPAPGGGFFIDFGPGLSASGNYTAFWGRGVRSLFFGGNFQGIYIRTPDGVFTVADTDTAVPEGSGTFTTFGQAPRVLGEGVVFSATSSGGQGLYGATPSLTRRLIDWTTVMPERTETFAAIRGFDFGEAVVAFVGESATGFRGVYVWNTSGVYKVADAATLRPDDSGAPFGTFGDQVAVQGSSIVFTSGAGVYAWMGGTLVRIADTSMTATGAPDPFSAVTGEPAVEGDVVCFTASTASRSGMYIGGKGRVWTLLDNSAPYDGKTVQSFQFTNDSLRSGVLAFSAAFSDGSGAVYAVRRVRIPPVSHIAALHPLRIVGSGGFQVLSYHYATGATSVTPYAAAPNSAPAPLAGDQWTGNYLYDYATARFSQATYEFHDCSL